MIIDQRFIENNRGSVMLMGLGMIVLTTTMIAGVTIVADKEARQRRYERESVAIREINSNVQGLLSDQRFCSDFLSAGFATTDNNKIPFQVSSVNSSSSYFKRSSGLIEGFQKKIEQDHNFTVDSVELKNMQIATGQGMFNDSIKTFDVTVNLKKIRKNGGIFDSVSFGLDGINHKNSLDHISLAVSEKTGQCTVYKKAMQGNTVGSNALRSACTALGGTIDPVSYLCNLKKFKTDDGIVKYLEGQQDGSNLSDALCELEKNILKKDRKNVSWGTPHNHVNQSNSADLSNRRNWTNFCKQPQWGGCYFDNKYYLQGEKTTSEEKLKAKHVAGRLKEYQNKAIDRRVARLYMKPPNVSNLSPDYFVSLKQEIDRTDALIGNVLAGGIGAALWGTGNADRDALEFSMGVWGANLIAASIFGVGPGTLIVGLIIAFGPKCDNAWIETTYVCKDGVMERDSFKYRTERPKKSKLMLSCKKKGWSSDIPVTADHEIVQQVRKIAGNQGAGLTKTELELSKKDMTNSFTQEEDLKYENQIISEIENVNSLTELMSDEDDSDVEVGSEAFSQKIADAYIKKEKELLGLQSQKIADLEKDITKLLNLSKTLPLSYDNTMLLRNKRDQLRSILRGLERELQSYQGYQSSLKGVDTQTVSNQLSDLYSLDRNLDSV